MKANGLTCGIVFLILALMLASCAPPNSSAVPTTSSTSISPRPSVPQASRTPLPSPTAASTPTPTPLGAIVLPTPPANGVSLTLTPDSKQTGWVGNSTGGLFAPDNSLNVGMRQGQALTSIVQFDLTRFAPGTKLSFAALELSGRNANNLGTSGQWTLDVLDTQLSDWRQANFDSIRRAPALFTIGTPLSAGELAAGVKKRFVFSATQLASLQKQIDRGYISIRLG